MMSQIFGQFRPDLHPSKQYVTIVFAPASLPIRWSNIGLSADFLASYFEAFFPQEATKAVSREEIKDSISYIANELMENAVKFHHDRSQEISITVSLSNEELVFLTSNTVDAPNLPGFYSLIQELTSTDPGDLLIRRIETNAKNAINAGSGLGLLTIMSDYHAKIGWKFEVNPTRPGISNVTTMVQLPFSKEI